MDAINSATPAEDDPKDKNDSTGAPPSGGGNPPPALLPGSGDTNPPPPPPGTPPSMVLAPSFIEGRDSEQDRDEADKTPKTLASSPDLPESDPLFVLQRHQRAEAVRRAELRTLIDATRGSSKQTTEKIAERPAGLVALGLSEKHIVSAMTVGKALTITAKDAPPIPLEVREAAIARAAWRSSESFGANAAACRGYAESAAQKVTPDQIATCAKTHPTLADTITKTQGEAAKSVLKQVKTAGLER